MQDLIIFPVQEPGITDIVTSALAGGHVAPAALVEALTILLETRGLPAAVSDGGALILNMEAQIDMLTQAEQRIAGRRAYLEGLRAAAADWAQKVMQENGVKSIGDRAGAFTLTRRKNPPRVEILNEDEIPQLYRKMELVEKIDKQGIAKALKDEFIVPGARLVQTERLEVK
jgi:hypothetical protein